MKLSPSSSKHSGNTTGPRLRKKHKRLDAICEDEYSRNHSESNAGNDGEAGARRGSSMSGMDLRRSSRVRRAPVVLDVSPAPVRKRRKIDNIFDRSVNSGVNRRNCRVGSVKEEKSEVSVTPGIWGSRLRSRERNKGGKVKSEDSGDLSRRRKLLGETSKKKGVEDGNLAVTRKKRRGRVKDEKHSEFERESGEEDEEEVEISGVKEESEEKDEMEVVADESELMIISTSEESGGDERESIQHDAKEATEEEEKEVSSSKEIGVDDDHAEMVDKMELGDEEEELLGEGEREENEMNGGENDGKFTDGLENRGCDDNVELMEKMEQSDKEGEQLEGQHGGENQLDVQEDTEKLANEVEEDGCLVKLANAENRKEFNRGYDDARPRIKQGRRCGLCGGGTDGKPPKRLIQDVGDSEHEVYSGSSASEEPNYDIWDGFGDEPGWLGHLLGPINDRYGIAGIWVHQHCAVWSPEVYFAGLGCLKNVRAALCRGRSLKCTRCGRPGATIGCRVDRCPKTYHLPCARANGCVFDHRKFLIACTDHRYLFQPLGNKYVMRVKKLKIKKMKLELRKQSNDALRKDVEAEEKWLENCGEDEEFLKRESKRLHRDLLRIAPVYIGGPDSETGKLFEGWESVAGLQDVIRCMKEVVILPLLYPDFFENMGLTPPRGVLLHGYPGTGKTHVVRALIGSCARGDKRIAYFARKGADCLGKYVGDAERQLRLLFQVAEKCQPSIIFFDEIDGLAPQRTRQQDQTHSSVVSTLLALMDGLKSRGSVVVIGATNRPEAVDPALRRPGRFDREIYFPLPSTEDRASILSLHTKKWPKPVAGSLLKWVARRTAGFAGADLQALCTQAAIIALKRNFPLKEVLSSAGEKSSGNKRVPLPSFKVDERDWLEALSCSPPPCSRRVAGIAAYNLISSPLPTHLIPCLLQPLSSLLVSLYLDERLWLPPPLAKAARTVKSVILSALDKKKVEKDSWWSHVDDIFQEADIAAELERGLSRDGIMLTGEANFGGFDASAGNIDEENADCEPSTTPNGFMQTSTLQNISVVSNKKSGFRILISGCPRSGQSHLAACLLHCFVGNLEIQKIDLATISQEGCDDMSLGLTRILMKCSSVKSCLVFMPRIDLWAVETLQYVNVENDSSSTDCPLSNNIESSLQHGHAFEKESASYLQQQKSAETAELQYPSPAWKSFMEQVESICVSTSLMILATSEVPYTLLPQRIRQFFEDHGSSSSNPISSKHTVPRFSVQLGGSFNLDMVINLSAAKLSRDIIQLVVQLTQQRTHACINSHKKPKSRGPIKECTDNRLASNGEARAQPLDGISKSDLLSTNNRALKGRSNLLLAISTLGYQILRYPHFAELCWFTSKLKEGPCADITGPWKGWPFNTCIIRPSDSSEKGIIACASSINKSKEKSGLVRGLIAVGLLAYRGLYASLKEVCFDVRRVFELLVGEVNARIQGGKDRCRYVRLLSQVAFLEDVVNSWAYSLQSLDLDAQVRGSSPQLNVVECPDNSQVCSDNLALKEQSKPNVSNKNPEKSEGAEGGSEGLPDQNIECLGMNNGSTSETRAPILEEGSTDKTLDHSALIDESVDNIICKQNGTSSEQHEPERTINLIEEHPNGFALIKSVTQNNPSSLGELGGIKFSDHANTCDQTNGFFMIEGENEHAVGNPSPSGFTVEVDQSSAKPYGPLPVQEVLCYYHCCSKCLYNLHTLMQKILTHTVESYGSNWSIEDIHDVVASLSADLLSAVGKIYSSGSNLSDENPGHETDAKLPDVPELDICHCSRSPNSSLFAPVECICHSLNGNMAERNARFGSDLEFSFRDGVLAPVHSNRDLAFHCKFEKLCLCSLIKSVLLMKRPFE